MNFFHNWGKAKISNGNKDRDNVKFESNIVIAEDTISNTAKLISGSNSRTYYKTKNRKKNFLFTRSLWYDVEREEKNTNLKKSQSVDNLETIDAEEYFSENNSKNNPIKQEAISFNTLKKSFSLENVAKKGSNKGKTKGTLTKDMISSPTDFRKITDDKQFSMFVPFEKIIEEHDISERDKNIPESNSICIEIEEEKSKSVITLHPPKTNLRRSHSMGSLFPRETVNPTRKSSCPNELLQTTVISNELSNAIETLGTTSTITTESTQKNREQEIILNNSKMDICGEIEHLKNLKVTPSEVDVILSDSVDSGALRKHEKESFEKDIVLRNRKLHIVNENELCYNENLDDEVLKTLQLSRDDSNAQYYPPQKFPLTDDAEGIQYRKNPITPYRISKTTDFDFPRKPFGSTNTCQDFDVRGCGKIQLPNSSCQKLKKNDVIKYQNGNIYRCTDNYEDKMQLIYNNVKLRRARMLTKREVELRDENNLIFILIFDSSKDAKVFLESDKLTPYVADDHKSSVKKTLFRLLGKRSSREVLEKKGIYQNEPIFGNTLKNIYNIDRGVPKFILKTIELIEKPENIISLGIYRTSGNLATIQKIRFEVDKGRLEILDDYSKDVDVLTGSLKLFFRELKEPLISCDACDQLLSLTKADKSYTKKDKDKIRSVLNHLPEANWETLRVLLKHLIEVAKYKEQNKMDTYNLSVCWGPTVIFATEVIDSSNYKDIVTQSTEATRMFESLLLFFTNNPEELEFGNRKQDSLDRNRNHIFRQDSKESIQSSDSNTSKGTAKRSASNLSLDIDDIIRKIVELIELNLDVEGIYKKPGVTDKVSKISKKITKKKLTELDKYKHDVLELCMCLKSYLQGQEPLVTRDVVEQIIKFCDRAPCLEQNTRQRIMLTIQALPKKDTFTFLLKHIITLLEHEPHHKVTRSDIISIWTNIFNQKHILESDETFLSFLKIILEVYDEKKPDIVGSLHLGMNNGLLNDLKNHQKERDRTSKYDNVPDDSDIRHEAIFLDEKTDYLEHTKL